jgi:hypothetical protein
MPTALKKGVTNDLSPRMTAKMLEALSMLHGTQEVPEEDVAKFFVKAYEGRRKSESWRVSGGY